MGTYFKHGSKRRCFPRPRKVLEISSTLVNQQSAGGGQKELSLISENVKNLTKAFTFVRYYFPECVRDKIQSDAVPRLFKD